MHGSTSLTGSVICKRPKHHQPTLLAGFALGEHPVKLVLKEFVGNVVKANFCFFFKRYIKQTINAKYKPATQFCSMPESEKLEIMSQLHIHQVCKLDYIRSSQHLFQFSFFSLIWACRPTQCSSSGSRRFVSGSDFVFKQVVQSVT